MRILLLTILISLCYGCKTTTATSQGSDTPDTIDGDDCYPNRKVVFNYIDAEGRVGKVGDYYIIHHNNGTGRLHPCTLPDAFKVEDLRIVFSGDQVEINPGERRLAMPIRLHRIYKAEQ